MEKKWAVTANFVMKNKSVLAEHNEKIVKNESEIGELRANVANNYYTKEDTYSKSEVNTQLETKVDKKEFYDYQNNVKKDIANTKSELRHVGSLSAALSGLHPMQYDRNSPNQLMASVGSYRDKQAIAVGLTHYFKENLMITGGVAITDDRKAKSMANLGITYKFGKGGESSENISRDSLELEFEKLVKENDEQKVQLDNQFRENEDLKHRVQNQEQEIQKIKEQLQLLTEKR